MKDNCNFRIGYGNRIRFSTDHWCGPSTLYISFPSLFDLVVNKLETVVEVWDSSDGSGSWKLNLLKPSTIEKWI